MKLDDRDFLQDLREGAERQAKEVKSETWIRAYLRLADAADCLDAMEARTIDNSDNIEEYEG